MSQEILKKLEELQAEFKAGHSELSQQIETGLQQVLASQDALQREVLAAISEGNEASLGAISALSASLKSTREKLRAIS